jgi:hypothetical protein
VAGALEETEYRDKLETAGFTDIDVESWRVYEFKDAPGQFASAFIRARKPQTQ